MENLNVDNFTMMYMLINAVQDLSDVNQILEKRIDQLTIMVENLIDENTIITLLI